MLVGESACLSTPWAGVAINQAAISAFTLKKAMNGEMSVAQWETNVLANGKRLAGICKAVGHGMLVNKGFRIGKPVASDVEGANKGPSVQVKFDGNYKLQG